MEIKFYTPKFDDSVLMFFSDLDVLTSFDLIDLGLSTTST